MNWMDTIREITDTRPAAELLTEYFWNQAPKGVSHLVVENTFADFGDAATVCGAVATSADLFPNYDLCPDCLSSST